MAKNCLLQLGRSFFAYMQYEKQIHGRISVVLGEDAFRYRTVTWWAEEEEEVVWTRYVRQAKNKGCFCLFDLCNTWSTRVRLSACKWLPLWFKNVKKWSLFHCLLTTFSWKCKSNWVQNKKPYRLIMILWRRGTYSDGFTSFQWNYLIFLFWQNKWRS